MLDEQGMLGYDKYEIILESWPASEYHRQWINQVHFA